MERLDGIGLGNARQAIADRGLDPVRLGRALFDCLLGQVAIDGVFHADPHPGNFLLLADGRIGMLDLGSVGRLDPATREALQRFLLAIDHGDPVAATDALLEIVYQPDAIDERALERAVGQFMTRHLAAGVTLGPAMFNDLFRIITSHDLGVPPEVAAVFRALATIEGTITRISPGFDLVAASRQRGPDVLQIVGGDHDVDAAERRVHQLDVHARVGQLARQLAQRARSILDVDDEHLAPVHDAQARRLDRGHCPLDDLVGDQHVDDPPPLAGEGAHALDVHPCRAGGLSEPCELARLVPEHHCQVGGHAAESL